MMPLHCMLLAHFSTPARRISHNTSTPMLLSLCDDDGPLSYESAVGGRGTVDGVADMIQMDLPSYLSLLSVTGRSQACLRGGGSIVQIACVSQTMAYCIHIRVTPLFTFIRSPCPAP